MYWILWILLGVPVWEHVQGQNHTGCNIDVTILVDMSGSIVGNRQYELGRSYDLDQQIMKNWYSVTNFTASLITLLRMPTANSQAAHVALLTFSNDVQIVFDFKLNSTSDMLAAVTRLSLQVPDGNTNTYGALLRARRDVFTQDGKTDRSNIQDVIIMLTDGQPTEAYGGYYQVLDQAQNLKSRGIIILAVGVTDQINTTLLQLMVTNHATDYFNVTNFQALQAQIGNIITDTCTIRPVQDFVAPCNVDLAFVVDSSGGAQDIPVANPSAVRQNNWDQVISFINKVTDSYNWNASSPDNRPQVAVVTYSDVPVVNFDLNQYNDLSTITQQVSDLTYLGGQTNTALALQTVYDNIFSLKGGDRPDVPNALVLVTDGAPNMNANQLSDIIHKLQATGVRLVIVYINSYGPPNQDLISYTTDPKTSLLTINEFYQLNSIYQNVTLKTCDLVAVECSDTADIYFVLDASGSIGEVNFNYLRDFMAFIIQDLQIGPDKVRLGVLLFSTDIEPQFGLNNTYTKQNLSSIMTSLPFLQGTTDTAKAIRYLRLTGFTTATGSREAVTRIAVLLTDGNSNNVTATLQEALLAKQAGIRFITIGVGRWTNVFELETVASHPYTKNYFALSNYTMLNNDFRIQLRSMLCQDSSACSPFNPCQCGGTCMADIGTHYCLCPSGCAGGNCEKSCSGNLDVIFAVDTSGSVNERQLRAELDFVTAVARQLNVDSGTRVGLLHYDTTATVLLQLKDSEVLQDVVNSVVASPSPGGLTNTFAALQVISGQMFTVQNGDRPGIPNVLVLLTDGRSTNLNATWLAARVLHDQGVVVMPVGIGLGVSTQELQVLASDPGQVTRAASFDSLVNLTDTIFDRLCSGNLCSGTSCLNGGTVNSSYGVCQCVCPTGYSGNNCERNCTNRYDIVLIIDSSGSIRPERFPQVVQLIASFVSQFQVGASLARFAGVVFSDEADVIFSFNNYSTRQDVITALQLIQFRGGKTNIAQALALTSSVLQASSGDRAGVLNHLFIFTDGNANINMADTIPQAIALRLTGAQITVLGVGSTTDMIELRGLASEPYTKNLIIVESFSNVIQNMSAQVQLLNSLVATTCNSINECASNPCLNGGTCIDGVFLFYCNCPLTWSGHLCERRCTQTLDVALVLDFSGSLDQVFNVVVAFAREVVYGLPTAGGQTRVAVVTYEGTANISFLLNTYSDKRDVLSAMAFSHSGGGKTNTAAALQVLRDQVFSGANGDRGGVPDIGVIVTDGKSNVQKDLTAGLASQLRQAGVTLYAVVVGSSPDYTEINAIASDPDLSHTVQVTNSSHILPAANQLIDLLCS